ncbi:MULTISPECIES: hypothetical protein [Bradyrhizobium]|nr:MULTISPECIES: hypothetical protein [Bradyrhizobium]UQR60205.1 hypothetical protein LRP30_24580 [Bradyrhizobium sp. C-145]
MEQKHELQLLSAEELRALRKDVDATPARTPIKRKSMLEKRLQQLLPRQVESRARSVET